MEKEKLTLNEIQILIRLYIKKPVWACFVLSKLIRLGFVDEKSQITEKGKSYLNIVVNYP